jgi:hypothetical protein
VVISIIVVFVEEMAKAVALVVPMIFAIYPNAILLVLTALLPMFNVPQIMTINVIPPLVIPHKGDVFNNPQQIDV